jgi:hypothetical protein
VNLWRLGRLAFVREEVVAQIRRAIPPYAREDENISHIVVKIHRCTFDGIARDPTEIEAGEPAVAIRDRIVPDTEQRGLGKLARFDLASAV